jgi:hypothetical protein
MNEELKMSDLAKDHAKPPAQKGVRDFYSPVDTFNSIRNNTTIEDTIKAQPDYLNNNTLSKKIQLLNDKTNQYDLINNKLSNLDVDIAEEFSGRGITQLGRRNKQLTRGRELDAQRQQVLSEAEYLRGNIQTAQELARSAAAAASSGYKNSSTSAKFKANAIARAKKLGVAPSIIAQMKNETERNLMKLAVKKANENDDNYSFLIQVYNEIPELERTQAVGLFNITTDDDDDGGMINYDEIFG